MKSNINEMKTYIQNYKFGSFATNQGSNNLPFGVTVKCYNNEFNEMLESVFKYNDGQGREYDILDNELNEYE